MIIAIEGKLAHKEPTVVHVNVQGIYYEVFVSLHTSMALVSGETVKLHTTHIVREDAQLLFGFFEKAEKILFDTLIKINGVGPKVAMAICSTFTPKTFAQMVLANDASGLKRVPGIGPKSASRILVELGGVSLGVESSPEEGNPMAYEASMALESLGFKKEHIQGVLRTITASNTSDMVKQALKLLQKG
ncbi:MAG: ATP-dependent DNA helicase RuvA [Sulfuricurvum sp. PC08-66]|nr:MAG: ATP-dependent DNA helicase RuvA [Sulfuricurvum sp. PC08-66]